MKPKWAIIKDSHAVYLCMEITEQLPEKILNFFIIKLQQKLIAHSVHSFV